MLERQYEGETRDLCRSAQVPYLAFAPTAKGFLAGRLSEKDRQYPARQNYRFYHEPWHSLALEVLAVVREVGKELGKRPIEVSVAWDSREAQITVRDWGAGIAPELVERMMVQ